MQIKSQAEACAENEPMFGDLLLVAGFVEKLFEVIVFAVLVAVVAQAPFRVQIDGIACAAGNADLEGAAEADRIPEEAHHGVDRKPGAPECEGGIVFNRQVFVSRRQVTVQRDDVSMITY